MRSRYRWVISFRYREGVCRSRGVVRNRYRWYGFWMICINHWNRWVWVCFRYWGRWMWCRYWSWDRDKVIPGSLSPWVSPTA